MLQDKKVSKLVRNTKIFTIGSVVSKLFQYLIVTLCTYKLSKSDYGIADTLLTTATIFIPIITLDISEAVFRFSTEKKEDGSSFYSSALFVGVLGFSVVAALYPAFIFIPFFKDKIALIYLLTGFEALQGITKEYIRGIDKPKDYIIGGFINIASQIVFCLLFIYVFNLGLLGYIISVSSSFFAEFIYYFFRLKLYKSISIRNIKKPYLKEMVKFSLPLIPNTIMWWIIGVSDRYFILGMKGEESVGLYAVAAKFPAIITIVTSIFFKAWEISAIENKSDEDNPRFYKNVLNYLVVAMFVALGAFLIVIKPLVAVLVSGEYREAWIYSPFLLLAATFSSFQTFLGVNYTTAKDSLGTLRSTTFGALLNLGLNFILIRYLGIQGAAIATFVSYFAVTVFRFLDTKKYANNSISHPLKTIATGLLLLADVSIISFFSKTYWFVTIGVFVVIVTINIKEIISILSVVKHLFKRAK